MQWRCSVSDCHLCRSRLSSSVCNYCIDVVISTLLWSGSIAGKQCLDVAFAAYVACSVPRGQYVSECWTYQSDAVWGADSGELTEAWVRWGVHISPQKEILVRDLCHLLITDLRMYTQCRVRLLSARGRQVHSQPLKGRQDMQGKSWWLQRWVYGGDAAFCQITFYCYY